MRINWKVNKGIKRRSRSVIQWFLRLKRVILGQLTIEIKLLRLLTKLVK